MRVGGESVTLALLAAPKISAGGLIRLLPILIKRQNEESAFRIYAAECMRTITENTAKFAGGSFVQAKYTDIISPKPQDNRTCEEITADVVRRCGLFQSTRPLRGATLIKEQIKMNGTPFVRQVWKDT